ncbi:hypothetical protein SS50377_28301 [Spironucleus salmonicida]|uniref:Uncharacterized protein n=1 Tax=Spironucleus salmonicida TaxID=348837 RepID=A0A9P8LLF8_9EUKA|nr:hypothetical protein SS50377_28301 [Spironucleus salmonicida]
MRKSQTPRTYHAMSQSLQLSYANSKDQDVDFGRSMSLFMRDPKLYRRSISGTLGIKVGQKLNHQYFIK